MKTPDLSQLHETAQVILQEAHELFFEKGYEKSSMREIAERVGISKAAMYHHFENKERILYTLCVQAGEIINESMSQAIARNESSGAGIRAQLTDILYDYTTSYLKNKNFNKILLHEIESLPPEKKRVILDYEKSNLLQLKGYLQRMIEQGKLRPVNLTVLTFSLFAAVHWLYFWYRPDRSLSIQEIVEHIVDIYLDGAGVEDHG